MLKIDRLAIYERDQGLCGFCGQSVPMELLHLDHYPVPRAMGGSTVPENLRVAHRRCNIAAGKMVVRERKRLGLPPGPAATIRIPPDVLDQVKALAEIETRSVNGKLVQLVKEALAARAKNTPEP